MQKWYILLICVVIAFLATACESESDRRKERISQLQKEIDTMDAKTKAYDEVLKAYDEIEK